ncbi:MAG: 30S ribosomal protein S21 [Chloroflexi bacterium]|nr:30S ribosomal protein S21 [Chloroflexota bacterium]
MFDVLIDLVFKQKIRRNGLAYVTIRDGEDSEGLLKRFQSQMQRSGIMRELRNRRSFLSKGERRRLERQRSIRRARRRIRNSRMRQ